MTFEQRLALLYEGQSCDKHDREYACSDAIKIIVKYGEACPECLASVMAPIQRMDADEIGRLGREVETLKQALMEEEKGPDA